MEITKEIAQSIFLGVEFMEPEPYEYTITGTDKVFQLQGSYKAFIPLSGELIFSKESWEDLCQKLWQHSNKRC